MATAASTIVCLQCQRENGSDRRFCGGCGRSLWQACPQCGAGSPINERFCGSCGADIAAALKQRLEQCETSLAEARALADAHQYDAANAQLRGIADISDARLESIAARAAREIESVGRRGVEAAANAESALNEARQHLAEYAYERAHAALEQVPGPLRSQEHRELLDHVRSCRNEVLGLSGEIRAAIEEKRFVDLAAKLKRLLVLKPAHQQALQLADQLRDRCLKAARIHLAKHEYHRALEELKRIPGVAIDDEVEKGLDTAAELATLLSAVERAPLADGQIAALANRLCRFAPKNAKAAQLRDSIQQRIKQKPASPRSRAPNWAALPERTWLGPPVDELAYMTRAEAATDDVAKVLKEHPGQFFVAFGLALQAFGLSAMDADLTPRKEMSGLAKLAEFRLSRRVPPAAWGIDLTDSSLRAIKLLRTKEGVQICQVEFFLHPKAPDTGSADLAQAEAVGQTIRDFAACAGELKNVPVCVGIPGHRVLGRFFDLPPMSAKKVADSVQYEARHQLPIALEDLCWSYSMLSSTEGKGADERSRPVLVQACRDSHVKERISRFSAAGINVDCVQSDCVALHNALVSEILDEKAKDRSEAVAAVHIGATSTDVVVAAHERTWFRSFGIGGDDFIRALMRQLQIDQPAALELLQHPARARRYHQWAEAIEPLVVQVAGEVQRSLVTYQKSFAGHPVRQVFAFGEGFQSLILRVLRAAN
jgi:type IV pilus assembly protein PilM